MRDTSKQSLARAVTAVFSIFPSAIPHVEIDQISWPWIPRLLSLSSSSPVVQKHRLFFFSLLTLLNHDRQGTVIFELSNTYRYYVQYYRCFTLCILSSVLFDISYQPASFLLNLLVLHLCFCLLLFPLIVMFCFLLSPLLYYSCSQLSLVFPTLCLLSHIAALHTCLPPFFLFQALCSSTSISVALLNGPIHFLTLFLIHIIIHILHRICARRCLAFYSFLSECI
jgi:hypothetical protein